MRPLGHLLETSDDEQQEEDEDEDELGNDYQNGILADQIVEEIQEQEELTPSPSASAQSGCEPQPSSTCNRQLIDFDDNFRDDDDDAADHQYEYIHPSHLLERWSLSSHQSANSSSNINDINCLEQPLDEQDEETANIRTRNPSYLHSNSNLPIMNHQARNASENDPQQVQQQQLQQENHQIAVQVNRDGVEIAESMTERTASEPIIPLGRSFSSFTPINDQEILLYGGVSSQDESLDDCWLLNIKYNRWTRINLKNKLPRLWRTGLCTKNNEVVIIGGSSSDEVDEFCPEVLTIFGSVIK